MEEDDGDGEYSIVVVLIGGEVVVAVVVVGILLKLVAGDGEEVKGVFLVISKLSGCGVVRRSSRIDDCRFSIDLLLFDENEMRPESKMSKIVRRR